MKYFDNIVHSSCIFSYLLIFINVCLKVKIKIQTFVEQNFDDWQSRPTEMFGEVFRVVDL